MFFMSLSAFSGGEKANNTLGFLQKPFSLSPNWREGRV